MQAEHLVVDGELFTLQEELVGLGEVVDTHAGDRLATADRRWLEGSELLTTSDNQ